MAITANTVPANISNSASFNVTTSLTEDTTHVNLRIRADITSGAVVVATTEKPKGLPDFSFFDILKALVPGISITRGTSNLYAVSGGSPLVAYTILFTEVWENAGVTTTGATNNASGTTFKFVPAVGDGIAFTEYVMHDSNCYFACKTLRNNVTKYYTSNPSEFQIVFFTESTSLQLFYSKDGGAYNSATTFTAAGWGVIIVNAVGLMSGVTSNLRLQIGINGGAKISEVMTINVDSSQIAERVVLEFDGLVGGKEYLAFEGAKDISVNSIRNYYTSAKKARRPLSYFNVYSQKLETVYKDMYNAPYLMSLYGSESVTRLELSYVAPTPVTVISDKAQISSSDMFSNQVEIEYEA